jgi:hypothetical protein
MRLLRLTFAMVLLGCGGSGGGGDGADDGSDGADDGSDGADDGSDDGSDGGDDGDDGDGDGSKADSGVDGDYVPLVTATWSLASGQQDTYICGTATLTEDVYARALRPIAPLGTHHTTVDMNLPAGPDDPSFPCGPEFGEFYASGVGTGELVLPEGVALLAPAGQQLRVSLHLFNATPEDLSGLSGLEVIPVDPSEVEHTASLSYNGPMGFNIGAGEEETVVHETTLGAQTLVGIFPHMHQLGTAFRAVLRRSSGESIVLWDDDYQFESQEFAPLEEIEVQSGDTLETSCTWVNTTKLPVGWGTSSEAEMCYSILMSY